MFPSQQIHRGECHESKAEVELIVVFALDDSCCLCIENHAHMYIHTHTHTHTHARTHLKQLSTHGELETPQGELAGKRSSKKSASCMHACLVVFDPALLISCKPNAIMQGTWLVLPC